MWNSNEETVRAEMRRMIERVSSQSEEGENRMIELSDQLCDCLEHPSDYFHSELIAINDRDLSALRSLIHFREAAFVTATTKLNLGPTYPPGLQIQVKLMEETIKNEKSFNMLGAPEVLMLNQQIIRTSGAKNILDIGVFTGASALAAATLEPLADSASAG